MLLRSSTGKANASEEMKSDRPEKRKLLDFMETETRRVTASERAREARAVQKQQSFQLFVFDFPLSTVPNQHLFNRNIARCALRKRLKRLMTSIGKGKGFSNPLKWNRTQEG